MNCKSDSDRNTNPNKQIDDTGRSVSISHSTITPCPMDVGTAARCKWWSWSRGQEKKTARSTVCTVEEDCRASGIGFISTLSSSLLLCSPFWLVDHSRLSSALLSCLSPLVSLSSCLRSLLSPSLLDKLVMDTVNTDHQPKLVCIGHRVVKVGVCSTVGASLLHPAGPLDCRPSLRPHACVRQRAILASHLESYPCCALGMAQKRSDGSEVGSPSSTSNASSIVSRIVHVHVSVFASVSALPCPVIMPCPALHCKDMDQGSDEPWGSVSISSQSIR
jgi:hypothetical protein